MKLGLTVLSVLAWVGMVGVARADDTLPVVVEYVAPPECAPTEAFHALLQAQIARMPNPDRPWRFSVTVRSNEGSDYEGTLAFESGTRILHAGTCDDLVAALTFVIAMATPAPTALPPPAVVENPPAPLHDLVIQGPPPAAMVRDRDRADAPVENETRWRLGVRMQDWTNGAWLSAIGPSAVASVEPQWGSYRMMFELGVGVLVSSFTPVVNYYQYPNGTQFVQNTITWGVLDFQTCPLDLALGRTGLSVLGCGRFAAAINHDTTGESSGAIWVGAGGRLRWQTPLRVYIEAHANGLWGTQSGPLYGSPGWMDFGGAIGVRI